MASSVLSTSVTLHIGDCALRKYRSSSWCARWL